MAILPEVIDRPAPAHSLASVCSTVAAQRLQRPRQLPAQGALLDVLIAHRAMLVSVARGLLGCVSRAEDVVHDVFVKLVEFPNQEAIRQPVAYVTRMVRNASIDARRRQSLESVYHTEEDDGLDVPSPEPTPETALMTLDTLRRVRAALADLPARSQAAFEMVRLREETLQTAARALNVSPTLVHFMVRDAQRHCAQCIDACERGVACPVFSGGRGAEGKKNRRSNVSKVDAA